MHYSGPEGERFFHIMFDEGNRGKSSCPLGNADSH